MSRNVSIGKINAICDAVVARRILGSLVRRSPCVRIQHGAKGARQNTESLA